MSKRKTKTKIDRNYKYQVTSCKKIEARNNKYRQVNRFEMQSELLQNDDYDDLELDDIDAETTSRPNFGVRPCFVTLFVVVVIGIG